MPYVLKENGIVVGAFARKQFEGQEFLKDTVEAVKDFYKSLKDVNNDNEKINKRMRKIAIRELKADGELANDYPEE